MYDIRRLNRSLAVLNYGNVLIYVESQQEGARGTNSIRWGKAGTLYSGDSDGCVEIILM